MFGFLRKCVSDFATLKSSDASNQVSGTRGRLASGEDTDVSLSPKRHLRQLEMKTILKSSKFTEEEPFRNEGTKKTWKNSGFARKPLHGCRYTV